MPLQAQQARHAAVVPAVAACHRAALPRRTPCVGCSMLWQLSASSDLSCGSDLHCCPLPEAWRMLHMLWQLRQLHTELGCTGVSVAAGRPQYFCCCLLRRWPAQKLHRGHVPQADTCSVITTGSGFASRQIRNAVTVLALHAFPRHERYTYLLGASMQKSSKALCGCRQRWIRCCTRGCSCCASTRALICCRRPDAAMSCTAELAAIIAGSAVGYVVHVVSTGCTLRDRRQSALRCNRSRHTIMSYKSSCDNPRFRRCSVRLCDALTQ
jgi:hypothetical protein